jgi:hypothetical protein
MSNLHREQCNHLLDWEKIESDTAGGRHTYRTPVPGGWLIRFVTTHPQDISHLFLKDPAHLWGTNEQYTEDDQIIEDDETETVDLPVMVYDETPELTPSGDQNPMMEKKKRR